MCDESSVRRPLQLSIISSVCAFFMYSEAGSYSLLLRALYLNDDYEGSSAFEFYSSSAKQSGLQ